MENKEELRKIFNSAFYGLVLVGLVSVIIMTVISSNPEPLFNLKPGEVNSLSSICIVTGLNIFAQFIGTLSVAFIMGRQEHFFLNILRSINYLVIAAIILYGLTTCTGSKLLFLSKVTLAGTLVQYIVLFIVIMYREKYLSLRWCYFSYTTVRELYNFGLKSAILMISDRVQRQSLPIVIGHAISASSVVFFSIPKRLVDYAMDFVVSIGFPLVPLFSSIDANLNNNINKKWLSISRATSFITLPAATTVMFLGESFLNIWLGKEYGLKGKWIIYTLSLSFLITGLFANCSRLLIAKASW